METEEKWKEKLIFLPKDEDHKSIEGMLKKYGIGATEEDAAEVKEARRRLWRKGYCIVNEKLQ